MDKQEKWHPICGYSDLYEISTMGRVKSLPKSFVRSNGRPCHFKERVLKPYSNKDGYLVVNLTKDGSSKGMLVHRLVADAFLPNKRNFPEVNHKDENKKNNAVNNLEWCTRDYNCNYGNRNKKISQSNHKSSRTKKHLQDLAEQHRTPVLQLLKDNRTIVKKWNSTVEAEDGGFDSSHISACCRGKRKSHKGYCWAYAS